MTPIEITVRSDRLGMEVVWPDGQRRELSAVDLRAISRSAHSLRERLAGQHKEVPKDLMIEGVVPIGLYAVNIQFSDGYAKGIYPWVMLRNAEVPSAQDAECVLEGS